MKQSYLTTTRLKTGESIPSTVLTDFVKAADGNIHVVTPSGAQQVATSTTVQQAVAAALKKVTLSGTGSQALTHAAHQGAEVHAESGITAATMALTGFQTSGVQQTGSFYLFNYTGGNLPITLGAGWSGGISEDGDLSNDITPPGTLITIPHAKKALVIYDADGWVRATLMGVEVTQTELDAGLALKATKTITKNRDTVINGLTGRLVHLRSDNLTTGAIATWNDESGTGNNLTGTGTAQPTATNSAIGSHMAVRFDGTNDVVSRSSVNIGTDWTIAALVRTGTSLTGQILSDSYPSAVSYVIGLNTSSFLGGTANAICVGGFSGSWAGAVAPTVATVNTTYLITATRTQGGNYVLRINGTQVATSSAGTNPTFESGGTLYLGKRWDNAASEFWNGDIGEVQMFNRVLTAEELQITEGMLAWKYGQQSLLSTTHAYYVDAPAIIDVPVSSGSIPNATTSTAGLMSATDKTKLDGVATGAEVNVQSDWSQATNTADDFIKNKPTIPAATVINNTLTSTSTTEALSANQGKVLQDGKQATLVSNTNIKTVGGTTVLGAGDIPFPTFATSLRLMTPTDILEDVNRSAFLFATDLTAGAVASWGTFAQATAGNQPTAETVSDLGGRLAVKFDGTDDHMSSAHIDLGANYGIFAVIRTGATISANNHVISAQYPNYVEYALCAGTNTEMATGAGMGVGHFNGAWRGVEGAAAVVSTPYILMGMYGGGVFSFAINGGTATTATVSSDPNTTESTSIWLGRRWDNTVNSTNVFSGHIAALILKKSSAFTATEKEQLEGWAAWYYGRVASLPTGHTYKNSPPLITA